MLAKIEAITERVGTIVGSGKGGSVLVHIGTHNVEREGTTAIIRKYRNLFRTLKQTRVEQVILSVILPLIGKRSHRYRNCRGMASDMLVEKLYREEEVGFVDLLEGLIYTRRTGIIYVERGQQYLRMDSQQQYTVAWVHNEYCW